MHEKPENCIRILAVGDVIGRPGRRLLKENVGILKRAFQYDGLIVNVENSAGGFGVTPEVYREFLGMNVDVMTSGNHIYDKKGYESWFAEADRLLRPLNFPPGREGVGFRIFEIAGVQVGVLNLIGRVFMHHYDCPFRAADEALAELSSQVKVIFVDFHGEATSEKMGMGWYLSKRVSGVWGTHTHVPTADARIFDDFTGYITDLGMTGAHDSIIGMVKEPVIEGFRTLKRSPFTVAKKDPRLGGCIYDVDVDTGRCVAIKGLFLSEDEIKALNPV